MEFFIVNRIKNYVNEALLLVRNGWGGSNAELNWTIGHRMFVIKIYS